MTVASSRKVLLVGWDSADWRIINPLMDRGLMPVLSGLVERGVMGNLASLESMLSPIVWTTIATGKLPHKHGVLGFVEPVPLDEVNARADVRPVGSNTRQSKALWNILSEAGYRSHVVGWFASHPAEAIHGICVSERFPLAASNSAERWPIPANCISPESAMDWLDACRVHPTEITGEALLPFIPRAADLDQSDPRIATMLAELAKILAKASSIQAAATSILEKETEWDFLGVYFQAIDELAHHFMPFHPPVLPGVSETDVELLGGVMEMAYRFHDLMLGRLLALAGDDVTVMLVSDHGFESGTQRPGVIANDHSTMAGWHRRYGIIAMAGSGLSEDERIYGSSVLDVTPTVLHLMGLPVGEDMDGKVLATALQNPGEIRRRETWEDEISPAKKASQESSLAEQQALMDQLIALGYLEDPALLASPRHDIARRELDYNRIGSLVEAAQFSAAAEHARNLAAECPTERRYRLKLLQVLLQAQANEEAAACLAALETEMGPCGGTHRMAAHLQLMEGDIEQAMARFAKAEELSGMAPDLLEQIGWVLLRQRRWNEAEQRFRKALAMDEDRPNSLIGLARALVRQDQNEPALEAALSAVGLLHFLPMGHFQLGAILSKLGDFDRAVQAFEIGLSMQPGNTHARRYLALLQARLARVNSTELASFPS